MAERDSLLSFDRDLQRIGRIQDQAWEWIVGLEPELALKLLRGINIEVEERAGTFEWARQPFLVAKAYAAKNDEVAEHFFNDAIKRIAKLPACDPQFSLLVHKCFGKYLSVKRKFPAARKQYECAEQLAMAYGPSEELAQMHLRIIEVGYQIANNEKEQQDFELFKNVAYTTHCTFEHQYRAWMQHERGLEATAANSQFMRSSMPLDAEYFKRLLDLTSDNGHETDEDKNE